MTSLYRLDSILSENFWLDSIFCFIKVNNISNIHLTFDDLTFDLICPICSVKMTTNISSQKFNKCTTHPKKYRKFQMVLLMNPKHLLH